VLGRNRMNCIICNEEVEQGTTELIGGYTTIFCMDHRNEFHEHLMCDYTPLYAKREITNDSLTIARQEKDFARIAELHTLILETLQSFYYISKNWVEAKVKNKT
jgi:hypothetical protein